MWTVAASVWAFEAAMVTVIGTVWAITASMWAEKAPCGLLQPLRGQPQAPGGLHRHCVGCCNLHVECVKKLINWS